MAEFAPDPAFEAGSAAVGDLALCQLRLQTDARWPWLILIPRLPGLREIEDLSVGDRALMVEETVLAGQIVRAMGEAAGRPVEKLNVAALGNVTAQLHVHVIGRRADDAAWPAPVWGVGTETAYTSDDLDRALGVVRKGLGL